MPLTLLLLAAQVVIEATTSCPSAHAIGERLGPFSPGTDDAQAPTARARVEQDGDQLRITLRDGAGAILLERALPAVGSCAERARSAALVIAVWQRDLRPRVPPPRTPEAAAAPAPVPPAAPPRPTPPGNALPGSAEVARSPSDGSVLEAAAGFLGAFASTASPFAPGAFAEVSWGRRRAGLGVSAGLLYTSPRDEAFAMGEAHWQRTSVAVGGHYRWGPEAWPAELHVDALVGVLAVEGTGFAANHGDTSPSLGARFGLRLRQRSRVLHPVLDLAAVTWLSGDRLEVGGVTATERLPRAELLVALGVGADLWP
jgi:hypothetical protein